jgi:D-glycero-beta-D-manno-heptose 1-phosphate adenylyltransferase
MERVVFTNGCFDLIHPGHVDLLKKARACGTKLIVGLNSDRSVRAIKGDSRPFLNQTARAAILRELRPVDEVRIFEENTPERLIREIKPDVLVKGGDWTIEQIVGADFVLENGGEVFSIPFTEDFSTTKIAEKIKSSETDAAAPVIAVEKGNSSLIDDFLKTNAELFSDTLPRQSENIAKCAGLIAETLDGGGRIYVLGGGENSFEIKIFKALLDFRTEKGESAEKEEGLPETLRAGDLLIALNYEGQSEELIKSVMDARRGNCRTVALIGDERDKIASLCDEVVSLANIKKKNVKFARIAVGCLWREVIAQKKPADIQNG